MTECMVEIIDAAVSYDEKNMAIKNLNVKIQKGEQIAVLGSNGAGKSTFFLCLNGILPLRSGRILWEGRELKRSKKDLALLRREVGYVFQDPDSQMLAPTVESEISFGLMNQRLPKEEIGKKIVQTAEQLELTRYLKTPPHHLSGGEKKRVSIADILVMEPKLLLFDEPTAALDGKNTAVFEEILKQQKAEGKTILISTHDLDLAWRWADRILVFHEGNIAADDSPIHIFENQELLLKTFLKKPALYQLTELAAMASGMEKPAKMPRSHEEFEEFIKSIGV